MAETKTTTDDKLDGIAKHLDSLHTKIDGFGTRIDSLEKTNAEAAKLRADAERDEMQRAERARRDAESKLDPHAFADAQMRADRAYQAWGKQAPHALQGEGLRDFRLRLLRDLKQHSKIYSDSDLASIGDETAFTRVEGIVINDAVEASNTPAAAGAPLREVATTNAMGHRVRKFYGDPLSCWAPFMGGGTRFGRIVRPTK